MTYVSSEDHGIPILVIKTTEENLSEEKLSSKGKTPIWQAGNNIHSAEQDNHFLPISWIFLEHFGRQGKPSFRYHQFSNYTTAT